MLKKIFFVLISAALFFARPADAAVISLSASKLSIFSGDEITVIVRIDSEDKSINAAQATLNFPANIIQVESVSKADSIFNFWLEEPSFDNAIGKVSFIGGSTGGHTGHSLNAMTVNFKVIADGSAALSLTGSAVTASDGSGTNVLNSVQGLYLTGKEEAPPVPPVAKAEVPAAPAEVPAAPAEVPAAPEAPIILPPTAPVPSPQPITRAAVKAANLPETPKIEVPFYPDSARWYATLAVFLAKWNLPADVNKVATALNKNPNFNPTSPEGLFDNKYFDPPEEGINYLHVIFRNSRGWGDAAHYRIAIDTVPPGEFEIIPEKGAKTDYPSQKIFFESNDGASGIEKYLIRINDGAPAETKDTFYELPVLAPGEYVIRVEAKDFAGNATESTATIEILPIDSPKILFVSKDVFVGEGGLGVAGTASPNGFVNLKLKDSAGATLFYRKAESDVSGNWSDSFGEPLKKGRYYIEAVAEDGRGALSLPVKSQEINVRAKPIAVVLGLEITPVFFYSAIILLLSGGFIAGFLFYYFWRKQLERKVFVAARDVLNVLDSAEKEIDKMIKGCEGKEVTVLQKREVKFALKKLKNSIKSDKEYLIENIKEIKN